MAATPVWADIVLPRQSGADKSFAEAVALLSKGRIKEADERFRLVLEKYPTHVSSLLGRARIAVDASRSREADRAVQQALAINPNSAEAHNMAGIISLTRGEPGPAETSFRRAVELAPRYVTPRAYLAALLRYDKRLDEATREYTELIRIAPRFPAGHVGLAEILMAGRRTQEALTVLANWKAADPRSPEPANVLGMVYLAEKDTAMALAEFQASLAIDRTYAPALRNVGETYAAMGQTDKAITAYRTAVAAHPDDVEAFARLGTLLAQKGSYAEALTMFRRVLEQAPQIAAGHNNVAWLIAKTSGNLDEAARLSTRAIELEPKYADAYNTRGWVRLLQRDYPRAIADLRRGRQLGGERAENALHLGMAYHKTGKRKEALAELEKALALDPNSAEKDTIQRTIRELRG